MNEDIRKILELVSLNIITPEEGEKLIEAINVHEETKINDSNEENHFENAFKNFEGAFKNFEEQFSNPLLKSKNYIPKFHFSNGLSRETEQKKPTVIKIQIIEGDGDSTNLTIPLEYGSVLNGKTIKIKPIYALDLNIETILEQAYKVISGTVLFENVSEDGDVIKIWVE
ncbi:MAG: hypothetical protein LBV58_00555 [Acholeplasmatales bacterium]|jgi:hypothetical protein|nr:hypothetical protein [Acholeplasmatales bacterium]